MPLALGTWKATVNGTLTDLVIDTVTAQGVLTGRIFNQPIKGWWDEGSQNITFIVSQGVIPVPLPQFTPPVSANIPHLYTAYLFSTPPAPPPGGDISWTLAGVVRDPLGEAANGIAGTSRRNQFGWFAQLTQVV